MLRSARLAFVCLLVVAVPACAGLLAIEDVVYTGEDAGRVSADAAVDAPPSSSTDAGNPPPLPDDGGCAAVQTPSFREEFDIGSTFPPAQWALGGTGAVSEADTSKYHSGPKSMKTSKLAVPTAEGSATRNVSLLKE